MLFNNKKNNNCSHMTHHLLIQCSTMDSDNSILNMMSRGRLSFPGEFTFFKLLFAT